MSVRWSSSLSYYVLLVRMTIERQTFTNLSIAVIDKGEIYPSNEPHFWRLIWIARSAYKFETVDPSFKICLNNTKKPVTLHLGLASSIYSITNPCWPEDHAIPIRQRHVVIVFKPPADGSVSSPFLAVFELL